MKTLLIQLFTLLSGSFMIAQMGIGTDSPSANSILDFDTETNKGIILPRILNLDSNSVPGTLFYDVDSKSVQVLLSGGNTFNLSHNAKIVDPVTSAVAYDKTEYDYENLTENNVTYGTVIGASTTTVPGVLVLESTTKALVLPHTTDPQLNIKNPEPGTMAYDPNSKSICVFNGVDWTFWGH